MNLFRINRTCQKKTNPIKYHPFVYTGKMNKTINSNKTLHIFITGII